MNKNIPNLKKGETMIDIIITRRPAKHFLKYAMITSINGKEYDLNIDFLIWAHIRPKEPVELFLRPEVQPAAFKGIRSPVTKRKAAEGFFCGQYAFIWKPGIEKIRDAINRISFALDAKDNVELFKYCFNGSVCFSQAYDNRLEELQAYSTKNEQGIWSAPKWDEVARGSLIPTSRMPKEADQFFLNIFQCALKEN